MLEKYSLLNKERVASIREIQRNPSQALRDITRVIRGRHTVGFFLSREQWEEFLEDMAALGSAELKRRVRAARKGLRRSEVAPLSTIAKQYGL